MKRKKRKKKVFDMGREMQVPEVVVPVPSSPDFGVEKWLTAAFNVIFDGRLPPGTVEVRHGDGTVAGRVVNAGAFAHPFAYDDNGAFIVDRNGDRVLDIRGHGRLTGRGEGGLGLDEESAARIQDAFGRWVVERLNEGART